LSESAIENVIDNMHKNKTQRGLPMNVLSEIEDDERKMREAAGGVAVGLWASRISSMRVVDLCLLDLLLAVGGA
jgi:hypothetical protein